MVMLPVHPTPFFADKNKAFWRLQVLGWSGAMLLRAVSSLAIGKPVSLLALVLLASITGFSISLILAVIYRQLIGRRPLVTWGVTMLVLPLAVILYAFIDGWVAALYQPDTTMSFAQLFIGMFYLDATLLGAWSALYYAINFFLQIEEANDALIRLENQATASQLAMLRYQLNPHFLFNTLNSISTLVLLKQTEPANAMLSRLSSFLRYTLVNQPTARVTVAQEVETLQLYLDIERMRFEDRLRTRFQIEPASEAALVPSLLLQPLVENAIKYAVSAQEAGAEIAIATQVVSESLRIIVSDTGPGLQSPDTEQRLAGLRFDGGEPVSTGVGLANIRDRLAQAYAGRHRFETFEPAGGGFGVSIEIPLERSPPLAERPPARASAAMSASEALSDNARRRLATANLASSSANTDPLSQRWTQPA